MKFDFGSIPTRIGKALQGVFGSANKRALTQYNSIIKAVNDLTEWAEALSQEEIQGEVVEMKKLVQEDTLKLSDSCPVCVCEWEVGTDRALELPCKHLFHPLCVKKWFNRQNTCPLCR